MPVLENTRHELYCQGIFSGLSNTEAAKQAGFSPVTAHTTACRLLKKDYIQARLTELKEASADTAVLSVREAERILSGIARGKWFTKDNETPVPNISAVNTWAKIKGLYKQDISYQDNRSLTINVLDKRTRDHLAGIIDGQYKVLPVGKPDSEANEGQP
jgi:phage terminase small subunit